MIDLNVFEKLDISLEVHDCVTSTNDLAKERLLSRFCGIEKTCSNRPILIIADQQTAGRGRYGRSFYSPAGTGLYMSFGFLASHIMAPGQGNQTEASQISASLLTHMAAVATCTAIERVCGIAPDIKWVNDLILGGKKVCGVLVEGVTDPKTGALSGYVIGIGVNCYTGSFPEELNDIAISIEEALAEKSGATVSDRSFSRDILACTIAEELLGLLKTSDRHILDEYRKRCTTIGQTITVKDPYAEAENQEGTLAQAIDVADDGGLIVRWLEGPKAQKKETLHNGEISIR